MEAPSIDPLASMREKLTYMPVASSPCESPRNFVSWPGAVLASYLVITTPGFSPSPKAANSTESVTLTVQRPEYAPAEYEVRLPLESGRVDVLAGSRVRIDIRVNKPIKLTEDGSPDAWILNSFPDVFQYLSVFSVYSVAKLY